MTDFQTLLTHQGAALAPDGIPLHFGDLAGEYRAALEEAVILVRSHEGRLKLEGRDRLALPHRISTNDLANLVPGEGRPTLFVTPVARILDRATLFARDDDVLAITEPGRGPALLAYLQRNIFFNDDLRLDDLTAGTHQFAIHGPTADDAVARLIPTAPTLPPLHGQPAHVAGVEVFIARNRPLSGTHWTLVLPVAAGPAVWTALAEAGARPAGSLTYNVLRIRAGRPSVGRELSQDYIPLEVGLWDEVSFHKGCYTGQEIIARMESRNRLAKVMVHLRLEAPVDAPAEITHEGRDAGTLTSSVRAPDGGLFALAVVKTALAQPGQALTVRGVAATVADLAGAPPPALAEQDA